MKDYKVTHNIYYFILKISFRMFQLLIHSYPNKYIQFMYSFPEEQKTL